jgi:hypothetical protein
MALNNLGVQYVFLDSHTKPSMKNLLSGNAFPGSALDL